MFSKFVYDVIVYEYLKEYYEKIKNYLNRFYSKKK